MHNVVKKSRNRQQRESQLPDNVPLLISLDSSSEHLIDNAIYYYYYYAGVFFSNM